MKWGIVCKPALGHTLKEVRFLTDRLTALKQKYQLEKRVAKALKAKGVPLEKMDADIYVAVGGDGTVLMTLMHTDKPVLAINAGGVGFLSEVEPKYIQSAVDRILRGDYQVEERVKLACYLGRTRLPDAANEVTLQTAKVAKIIKCRIEVDGEVGDTIRGDGVIVATPTGSTGYSLSAGGPILDPRVRATVITPLAAFRLGSRPFVVPYESKVTITLVGRASRETPEQAKVVVDGQHAWVVGPGQSVTMKPSERKGRFVRFNGGFYERVRTKLTR